MGIVTTQLTTAGTQSVFPLKTSWAKFLFCFNATEELANGKEQTSKLQVSEKVKMFCF